MPAHRESRRLRALAGHDVEVDEVRDAALGGIGLDWTEVPPSLGEVARDEWVRLGRVFAGQPTRFRESDRPAVASYCGWWGTYVAAQRDLAERGPVVVGRSSADREHLVKNPSEAIARNASTQLRGWATALGLTPASRTRLGVDDFPDDPGRRPPADVGPGHGGDPSRLLT